METEARESSANTLRRPYRAFGKSNELGSGRLRNGVRYGLQQNAMRGNAKTGDRSRTKGVQRRRHQRGYASVMAVTRIEARAIRAAFDAVRILIVRDLTRDHLTMIIRLIKIAARRAVGGFCSRDVNRVLRTECSATAGEGGEQNHRDEDQHAKHEKSTIEKKLLAQGIAGNTG